VVIPTGPRPHATTFPADMQPSIIVGVDGGIVSAFFGRFFPLFDNQRSALFDVYHESATFSFQANTSIPARARIQGFQYSKEMPHQRSLEWSKWLAAGSRNLSRVAGAVDKMVKSLHVGREEAVKAMTSLPQTKHNVAGAPEKFCIDGWPVTQGDRTALFLSIHGQFTEEPIGGVRSFDRSFILTPAPEGSRAKANGWDVEVLSDQLVIRAYSSHEAWKPGPLLVQAPSAPSHVNPTSVKTQSKPPISLQEALDTTMGALNAIPEPQRSWVLSIAERTGLTVRFAIDCLQGNGWDVQRALANFEEVKGTLGREAFRTNPGIM